MSHVSRELQHPSYSRDMTLFSSVLQSLIHETSGVRSMLAILMCVMFSFMVVFLCLMFLRRSVLSGVGESPLWVD